LQIDDIFVDRILVFQCGDWFMTGLKATNTQNIPVFFYAINNEKLDIRLINRYYELDSGSMKSRLKEALKRVTA
jgi:hypothetical protein